jgi:[citrate (pro-3S)-lyase] ligase
MMDYVIRDILLESEIEDVKRLLEKNNLIYESTVTKTIGLYDKNQLIATGSIDHNVIKMIAVDPNYQSQNISSKILSHLLFYLEAHDISHYFLFTKPENKDVFSNYNFNKIMETKDIVLYENKNDDINSKLKTLKKSLPQKNGSRGCIVMNLNPITLGHLHLIENASKMHNDLIIFIVETDASLFDYKTRLNLLRKSIKHLKNIYVLPSTDYMISRATFPTYFLKDKQEMEVYTELDVSIFKTYFMPIFEIDQRHVGEEPIDELTREYNLKMKEILKDNLMILPRKTHDQKVISASYVRKLASEQKYDMIKPIVPKATYKFLISKKGRALFHG